jgi:hypothetical protein
MSLQSRWHRPEPSARLAATAVAVRVRVPRKKTESTFDLWHLRPFDIFFGSQVRFTGESTTLADDIPAAYDASKSPVPRPPSLLRPASACPTRFCPPSCPDPRTQRRKAEKKTQPRPQETRRLLTYCVRDRRLHRAAARRVSGPRERQPPSPSPRARVRRDASYLIRERGVHVGLNFHFGPRIRGAVEVFGRPRPRPRPWSRGVRSEALDRGEG